MKIFPAIAAACALLGLGVTLLAYQGRVFEDDDEAPALPTDAHEKAEWAFAQIVLNPDWQPLERMLGISCCESFMFMGCFGEIHLYKNIWTRSYLNLGPDWTCFRYTGSGYVAIRREEAINHVFS